MSENRSLPKRSPLYAILLAAVVLLGTHLRLTAVLGTEVDIPLRADAGQYFAYAYNLANHGVYSADLKGIGNSVTPVPDHLRNPGYPLIIFPFARGIPTDASLLDITLLQAALSIAVILLIYAAARRIVSRPAALAVALLTALSPHLINVNVYILSETAASFSIVLFLFAFIRCGTTREESRWPGWLASGILLGLATLIRPTMQWFVLPAIALIWLLPQQNRRKMVIGFVAGFLLTMAPWWIRNLIQFGEASDPSLMIATLHHGMYPGFMYAGQPETFGFPYRFDPRSAEITRSLGTVLAEILRRFNEQPLEHLQWFLVGKPLMFWNWENFAQGAGDVFIYPVHETPFLSNLPLYVSHEAMRWLHWPLVIVGVAGSLLCWLPAANRLLGPGTTWAFRVCGLLLLYFVVLHIVGAPFPRYSIPILPLLYLQATATLSMLDRLRSHAKK